MPLGGQPQRFATTIRSNVISVQILESRKIEIDMQNMFLKVKC